MTFAYASIHSKASAEDLEGLVYIQFPILPPFDTEEGGEALLSLVMKHQVDLVVIDTISRAIEGLENESSTWHRFYRYTLLGSRGYGWHRCAWTTRGRHFPQEHVAAARRTRTSTPSGV